MTKIISFANQKGGVGKSTLCIQLAFYLQEKGKQVLVIDLDPQGNTSSRVAPRTVLEDESVSLHFDGTRAAELFHETVQDLRPTVCAENLHLIHSPINDTELAEVEQLPLDQITRPTKHLAEFLQNYEYVLVDCPPNLSRKLTAALALSTHVVIPAKIDGFSIEGVENMITTVIGIQRSINPELQLTGVVINDMDRSVSSERALAQLTEAARDLIYENKIMHRPPLGAAISAGVPVWRLGYGHVAAKEVTNVLDEIIERVG